MSAATIRIWVRQKGARRQAFYRNGSTGAGQAMQVKHADQALRDGTMKLGNEVVPVVAFVPRETQDASEHPAAAAFRAAAKSLSKTMDAINGVRRTRGAA